MMPARRTKKTIPVGMARGFALFGLLFLLAATGSASAQTIDEHALRITVAGELGNGRLILLPQDGQRKPDAAESLLLGARLGLDVGLNRRLALEVGFAANWYAMRSLAILEFQIAPRIRFLRAGHDEWYIRPVTGVGIVGVDKTNLAFVAGLGLGYRRQLAARTDFFLEVGYRLRFMRQLESGYASRVFDFVPATAPNGLACFLGVTSGVGFGL